MTTDVPKLIEATQQQLQMAQDLRAAAAGHLRQAGAALRDARDRMLPEEFRATLRLLGVDPDVARRLITAAGCRPAPAVVEVGEDEDGQEGGAPMALDELQTWTDGDWRRWASE